MAWWYWFGMWIAAIAGLVIAWWVLVDTYRKPGSPARFAWPVIAFLGCMLQLPAFLIAPASRDLSAGTWAALSGVLGTVLVGMAAVTHFTGSSTGSSVWNNRTRDGLGPSTGSGGGARRGSAHAVVPIAEVPRVTAGQGSQMASKKQSAPGTPAAPLPGAPVAPHAAPSTSGTGAPTPPASSPPVPTIGERAARPAWDDPTTQATDEPDNDRTLLASDDPVRRTDATISADSEKTLVESADATVVDEPDRTVVDEPESSGSPEDDPGPLSATISVTDGRSSRIVVTERSGPFRVGRDLSRVNLAVDDGRVSRVHFVINRLDDRFILSDAASANGTFINGDPVVEPRELTDGDTIEFGRTVATFSLSPAPQ